MTRREWRIAAIAFVAGALILQGVIRINSALQIDGCLDAGGAWDYKFRTCDEARAGSN